MLWRFLVCAASVCAVGCSGEPSSVPVSGVVRLDEKPLADAKLTFDPASAGKTVYLATTGPDGKFSLRELESSSEGAPAGKYRVSITTARPLTDGKVDESTKFSPEVVPTRYRDGTLTFDVPAAGTTAANFDLQSR